MPERRKENEDAKTENIQGDTRETVGERRERLPDEETWDKTQRFVKTSHFNVMNEEIALVDKPGGLNILHERYCKKK